MAARIVIRQGVQDGTIPLSLAAEHEVAQVLGQPIAAGGGIGKAIVDPQPQFRKYLPDLANGRDAVAARLDRVEVSDVKRREGVHREQAGDDIDWLAAAAKLRAHGAVGIPLAALGMDDRAAFEVDDGNHFHGSAPCVC